MKIIMFRICSYVLFPFVCLFRLLLVFVLFVWCSVVWLFGKRKGAYE